jgi:hypothetical protein
MNLSNAQNAASACNYNYSCTLSAPGTSQRSVWIVIHCHYSFAKLCIAAIVDCVFLLLPGVIKSEGLLAIFSCATSNWFSSTLFVPLG